MVENNTPSKAIPVNWVISHLQVIHKHNFLYIVNTKRRQELFFLNEKLLSYNQLNIREQHSAVYKKVFQADLVSWSVLLLFSQEILL